jgi:hypothetical protein
MTDEYDFDYLFEAGTLRGIVCQIGARADPSVNNVNSFAVILFFELSDGTVVEVAKVDDSPHKKGTIHVDRYYRAKGADTKDFSVSISTIWEADEYLDNNWKRFVRTYIDNHGKQPRDDG